jgi:anti-sigma B factor antagonist
VDDRAAELVVEVQDEGQGTARVVLSGELDARSGRRLDAALARIETQAQPGVLILDLSGLSFIDSSGLRVLFHAERRARAEGRRIVLIPGTGVVQRVFEITGALARFVFEEPESQRSASQQS